MELVEANAIEFLGEERRMIIKKGCLGRGVFLNRLTAIECVTLEAHIGRDNMLVFLMDNVEFSYNGEYLVHWA